MDKSEFESRLAQVARIKKEKVARDPVGSRLVDQEPVMETVIEHVLPEKRPCEFCERECNGCLNHSIKLVGSNKNNARREWVTTCDTCKRKVDIVNRRVIPPAPVGTNYVAQGLRKARPGNSLGRPRKDFWNEPVQIYSEDEAREINLKHAGMLDRLAQLRNK